MAGAESSCRPPWLDTQIPLTPLLTAISASSFVRTPLTSTGSLENLINHFISSHTRDGSNCCSPYSLSPDPPCPCNVACTPSKFAALEFKFVWFHQWSYKSQTYVNPGGRVNRFLISARRFPNNGLSIVTTRALNPAFLTR